MNSIHEDIAYTNLRHFLRDRNGVLSQTGMEMKLFQPNDSCIKYQQVASHSPAPSVITTYPLM